MEPLGPKIRRQRRRLGLTLDELAGRTSISKPYLSLIETGRVPNPPSDEKLRRLEQTLGFATGELLSQAHLQRTPRDVRAVLGKLLAEGKDADAAPSSDGEISAQTKIDLEDVFMSGVLKAMAEKSRGVTERVSSNAVPVINRVSSGYPKNFSDLSFPPRVADDYVGCPDIDDNDAFAARVHGDSMTPKYREGDIVIFSPAKLPRNGDDCFIRFGDGQTTFKRVFFETTGAAPVLRLQPRNERYAAMVLPSEQASGVYRAVYCYQRVDED
jgi:SOS-response transcriptional repressor LexA